MMKRCLLVTAMLLIMVTSFSSYAAPLSEVNTARFRGIGPLGVLVEDLGEDGKRVGISEDDVRTLVEAKLRQNGIKVRHVTEFAKSPYLYVTINLMHVKKINHFVFTTRLDLAQTVRPLRANTELAGAKTWSQEVIGISSADKVRSVVKTNVEELMTFFLSEYHAVNGQESTKNGDRTKL